MSQHIEGQIVQFESNMAEAYDTFFVPVLFAPWATKLIDFAAIEAGENVLDLACGTGIVARLASQRVGDSGSVVGLDVNPAMLDVARRSSMGIAPPIEWREGSATDMPLPDASFDVVLCQASLMYFPEPHATQEMHRVLAPGGRLALSVWRPIEYSPGWRAMANALETHVSDEVGAMMRSPFSFGDAEHVRDVIREGGFSHVHIRLDGDMVRYPSVEEFVRIQAVSSPIGDFVDQLEDAARQALVEEIRLELGSYMDDDGLAFPIEAYLAVAHT